MIMETNNLLGEVAASPKDTIAPNEIGFIGAIGTKWKQNALTDIGLNRSESSNYIDTIQEMYPDMELNVVGRKGLNESNYLLLDTMWEEGYFKMTDKGVVGTDKYKARGISQNKFMPSDLNVAAVNTLRNNGVSPDKLQQVVLGKTKETWIRNERDLRYYDDTNVYGQSGAVDFVADLSTWMLDPINLVGLGAEVAGFKFLGQTLLKEGRAAAVTLAKKTIGKHMDVFASLTTKYGPKALKEAFDFMGKMRHGGASDKEIISMFKNKGTGLSEPFKDPMTKKIITDLIRKGQYQEVAAISGYSGFMAGVTEFFFQEETFDWKSKVLDGKDGMPKYSEKDRDRDIALSAAFGGVFGGVFNIGSNLLKRETSVPALVAGSEVIDEVGVLKVASDIEDSIPMGGEPLTDEYINPDITLDMKNHEEALNNAEFVESLSKEDNIEMSKHIENEENWKSIEGCMINNNIDNPGTQGKTMSTSSQPSTPNTYMQERETIRNSGGKYEPGEGSYNKGEISSEDIARARTGQMSRYKDESVPGSYNKQTWREFEVDLTRQGFSKEEAKNLIDNVYSMSGKKRTQALRDMGIELD